MEIINHRNGLFRLKKKLNEGRVTIGYIGGSITDQITGNRWPEYVNAWFLENYHDVRFIIENAAIGATGSDLAVFRAERDIISRGCDIVFIEFATNDISEPPEKRMRTREGLIRKLLKADMDIVLTYTFCQEMYEDMTSGKIPDTIYDFELLAGHYGIGSVWMGRYALERLKKGWMRWEEWLPDGVHPDYRGSLCYAESVIEYLKKELGTDDMNGRGFVKVTPVNPFNINNWEKTTNISLDSVSLKGPWTLRRWSRMAWAEQVLDTASIGAGISFSFIGKALALGFDFGRTSSEYRYRIDGGEWIEVKRERPEWCGDSGWYRLSVLAEEFDQDKHEFELEVIHGNRQECKGTNFRLALIGTVQ
jgi:hypothetical protein